MTRYIDADALRYSRIRIYHEAPDIPGGGFAGGYNAVVMSAEIKNAPTVDAEPIKHGKWIYGNDFHWYTASCNKCGYQRSTDIKADRWNQWNYCPNCGARMNEE